MKVIQLCGTIEGAGITRYLIEVNNALKLAGYDVIAYECTLDTNYSTFQKTNRNQSLNDTKILDYSDECINDINSADVVFVHQLMPKKASNELKVLFRDLIINKLTHPKKIMFFNDHSTTTIGFTKFYGGEWLKDKEFLDAFDHYAIHCNTNTYMRILRDVVGTDIANKKYVYMHHPYFMDESIKDTWKSLKEKHKRVTYIGRWHTIKHPERMLDLNRYAIANNKDVEFEMRGIVRLIGIAYIPGLFYEIDSTKTGKDQIVGPSNETILPGIKWKKERGLDKNDLLIDYPHDKMMIFGEYKREDGMLAISKSAFGAEFYSLKNASDYGDNLEYAMHEIIEQGTVPIFDEHMLKSVYAYKNGKRTDKSLYDLHIALSLKSDLSNIDEIFEQIDYLYNNETEYNDMRNRAYNVLKEHTDPVSTINEFINNCIK